MDLCLSCKGCKSECPTNVDIATYKSEFLSHYYEGRPRPLNHYAFGFIDRWARLASITPKLVNGINCSPVTNRVVKAILQVAEQREIPKFPEETFVKWARNRPVSGGLRPGVVLFADTLNNYFRPNTARAAWEVLQNVGFTIHVPQTREHLCCGRPLYDFGLLGAAKKYLQKVLDALAPFVRGAW